MISLFQRIGIFIVPVCSTWSCIYYVMEKIKLNGVWLTGYIVGEDFIIHRVIVGDSIERKFLEVLVSYSILSSFWPFVLELVNKIHTRYICNIYFDIANVSLMFAVRKMFLMQFFIPMKLIKTFILLIRYISWKKINYFFSFGWTTEPHCISVSFLCFSYFAIYLPK